MSGNSAREEILERIRSANANAGVNRAHAGRSRTERTAQESRGSEFRAAGTGSTSEAYDEDTVGLFAERVEDYKAVVEHCSTEEVAERLAAATKGAAGIIVPDGFPVEWARAIPDEARRADPGDADRLDHIEAVVTTSAAGIARTGTIVLDHSTGQGRRALTLVPDLHVCIVREADIHADVPQAVTALRTPVDAGRPLTWISGPSATSDIELSRVEGVHGPRRLHVIVVS